MANVATSSATVPSVAENVENPNPVVGIEGENPQTGDGVESPEVQALEVIGGLIEARPIRSFSDSEFSA